MCVFVYVCIYIYTHTYEQYFRKKKNISELLGGITVFYLFVLEHFVLLLWNTSHNYKSREKADRKMMLWEFQSY